MTRIEMSIRELRSRGHYVKTLLKPITLNPTRLAWKPYSGRSRTDVFVLGFYEGREPNGDYTKWRFSTVISGFRAMYYERWLSKDTNEDEVWYLERAYLHLYRTIIHTRQEEQFLCLHCDPNEPASSPHAKYKQVPHLHIRAYKAAPFDHAHLALSSTPSETVDVFSAELKWAVQMLRDEVLDRMK